MIGLWIFKVKGSIEAAPALYFIPLRITSSEGVLSKSGYPELINGTFAERRSLRFTLRVKGLALKARNRIAQGAAAQNHGLGMNYFLP